MRAKSALRTVRARIEARTKIHGLSGQSRDRVAAITARLKPCPDENHQAARATNGKIDLPCRAKLRNLIHGLAKIFRGEFVLLLAHHFAEGFEKLGVPPAAGRFFFH